MKKKLIVFFTVLALCLSIASTCVFAADEPSVVYATDTPARLVDGGDLLTDSEESELIAKLDEISERQGVDVVVVTATSLNGKSSMAFADDFFDYNGYGQGDDHSGVLLLHSPEERDWWISTSGACIKYFSDEDIDDIGDEIKGYFDTDCATAYTKFAEMSDNIISDGKWLSWVWIPISIVAGFVIALIVVFVMIRKLKSVRFQPSASNYLIDGSFNVTDAADLFLYRNVTRKRKPQSSSGSSTHTSSSGASHGGGGGKY